MRKSVHLLMTFVALGILFGCATVSFGQNDRKIPMVGSTEKATDDVEVVAAAEFAVSAQKEKEGGPLSLVSIKSANLMSTRDTAYLLCLEIKAADEDDAGVEAQSVEFVVSAPSTREGEKKKWKLNRWTKKDCGDSDSDGNHATLGSAPADSITSIYSSLSKCRKVASDVISSTHLCGGIGGYKLQREYGDGRESITVISPNGKKHQLEFWNVISSAFSHVGEKAEWRVIRKKGKVVPVALIVRFTASEYSGDTPKPTSLISYLAVAKITPQKICVTDKIAPSRTANEEARVAADASADKPCVNPPEALYVLP
jgi:hypothetical protein